MGKKYIKTFDKNYINNSDGFICKVCNKYVKPLDSGGRERNHCPYCLSSLHVDNEKGDRKSNCNETNFKYAISYLKINS